MCVKNKIGNYNGDDKIQISIVYLSYFSFLLCVNPQVELLCKITTGLCLSTVSAATLILAEKYKEDSSTKSCITCSDTRHMFHMYTI